MLSNCLIFHTSGSITSSPAVFLFLIFPYAESSSYCINRPSLMSYCLLIILVFGSCVTFGGYPSKFSQKRIHLWKQHFKNFLRRVKRKQNIFRKNCTDSSWIKTSIDNFDIPMGRYDSAQISDLMGLYLLNTLTRIVNPISYSCTNNFLK